MLPMLRFLDRRALRRNLKFVRFSSNVVSEEFVLRSLRAFPLEASFYAWSGGSRSNVRKVSVGL